MLENHYLVPKKKIQNIKMPTYKVRMNGAECQKFFVNGVTINEIIAKGEPFEHN